MNNKYKFIGLSCFIGLSSFLMNLFNAVDERGFDSYLMILCVFGGMLLALKGKRYGLWIWNIPFLFNIFDIGFLFYESENFWVPFAVTIPILALRILFFRLSFQWNSSLLSSFESYSKKKMDWVFIFWKRLIDFEDVLMMMFGIILVMTMIPAESNRIPCYGVIVGVAALYRVIKKKSLPVLCPWASEKLEKCASSSYNESNLDEECARSVSNMQKAENLSDLDSMIYNAIGKWPKWEKQLSRVYLNRKHWLLKNTPSQDF